MTRPLLTLFGYKVLLIVVGVLGAYVMLQRLHDKQKQKNHFSFFLGNRYSLELGGHIAQELQFKFQNMDLQSSEQTEPKAKVIDGKYVIDMNQLMGGGSYSQVYAAWPKNEASIPLACKIISKVQLDKQISQKKGDEQSKLKLKMYIIKRIQSEIVIGHKIKHPNIVEFVYFSQTGNNIYIFMERCETNLETLIRTRGPLQEKNALSIFKDIVAAACILYDNNITHRDIKAQNILIKANTAKLADFGFAKELREKDNQENGTGVGTMLYMAPQLIFQQKPIYSIKCDVWSIGVVMYYVLFGTVPWDANQTIKNFQLSLKKPIDFNPNIALSLRMKNLISKMLIFKQQQRINIKDVKIELDDMISSVQSK